MPRYLSFLFLFYLLFLFYVMFCFVLTSPPLMLCVYLQTFEAALFWKKKNYAKLRVLYRIGVLWLQEKENGNFEDGRW